LDAAHGHAWTGFAFGTFGGPLAPFGTSAVAAVFARRGAFGLDRRGGFDAFGTRAALGAATVTTATAFAGRGRFGLGFSCDRDIGGDCFRRSGAFRTIGARAAFTRLAIATATGRAVFAGFHRSGGRGVDDALDRRGSVRRSGFGVATRSATATGRTFAGFALATAVAAGRATAATLLVAVAMDGDGLRIVEVELFFVRGRADQLDDLVEAFVVAGVTSM
jgi:hypothetical protein